MKYRNNKIYRLLFLLIVVLSSCEDDADIKRDFEYEVKVEKYHENVKVGEVRELVFSIIRDGEYENTGYEMNYFIREGNGTLCDETGSVLKENTAYKIVMEGSHLFYKVQLKGPHKIEFVFQDSFGKEKEVVIELSGID